MGAITWIRVEGIRSRVYNPHVWFIFLWFTFHGLRFRVSGPGMVMVYVVGYQDEGLWYMVVLEYMGAITWIREGFSAYSLGCGVHGLEFLV